MATFENAYANAKMTRSADGILEVTFHTNGGKLVFNGHTHEQFTDMFHEIGEDYDNRVVILTGSGDAFMDAIDAEGFDFFTPRGYDKIFREGRKILMNILDIDVPMIAGLNGPVLLHSEYVLLWDIVIATPETVFQDMPHYAFGIAPKRRHASAVAGSHRQRRGRYFLLTQQKLSAQEAKDYGAVNEIVPADRLMTRGREIAVGIAKLPPLTSKYTRIGLTQHLRRLVDGGSGYGLALEGITAADVARISAET
jgi:enoyl-CoA hydratase/carnithine racemase